MSGQVPALPSLPALVVGTVHHVRHRPLRHAFTHKAYSWLIDLDAPPAMPWWARPFSTFRGEDHLAGAPGLDALKANALRVLARELDASTVTRVLMLANARVFGHVFDPMSLFWCLDADGAIVGTVVEVHNTYGERHAYVVPGEHLNQADVGKAFYVSPFNDVSGSYAMRIFLSDKRVGASIRLTTQGELLLTATTNGRPRPATPAALARLLITHPLMTWRVSGLIRVHGIWLWLRRLPVQPRRPHPEESLA